MKNLNLRILKFYYIHDSVLVESPEKDSTKIASLLKETMENVYKLPIELTVDTKIAKNWGEL
jgi:DNA polymerase I-like protein with 3'-5' exonuclease and polymerase domains